MTEKLNRQSTLKKVYNNFISYQQNVVMLSYILFQNLKKKYEWKKVH